MVSRKKELEALRSGQPLPAHRIVQLRSSGMHSIRFEFVVRLLRSGLNVDTLAVYWENGSEFMLKREPETATRKLVLGGGQAVSGNFPELWLLCYPDDEEVKRLTELEIDRMVESAHARASR